ncbi:hypothetical protein ACHAXH_004958 [Discostella pseudostelligera]
MTASASASTGLYAYAHESSSPKKKNHEKDSSDDQALKSLSTTLTKMNSIVTKSLHRSIRQGNAQKMSNDGNTVDGASKKRETPLVDYLTVKNSLMMSYLIDLTLLLRSRISTSSSSSDDNQNTEQQHQQQRECVERLQEMKIALEKMRPLEKKMRYQIDKLLALSTVISEDGIGGGGGGGGSAGMFASVGREIDKDGINDVRNRVKNGGNDGTSDPLSYKPDLRGMMKNMFFGEDGEDNEERGEIGSNDDDDGDDDIDQLPNRAKIFLDKEDNNTAPSSSSSVYQPPRLQSVPFELDNSDRAARKHERNLEKKRERQSRSELTQVIKSQFTDAPEEEDARGGTSFGLQSDRSRKISSKNAELEAFEEGHMMRLSVGRKEKKERKRMMREEMSNLGAIADGLGNVVAGVDDAFGGGGGRKRMTTTGKGGTADAYKTKGMRRRKVDVIDHEGVARKKKKSSKNGGATNTYQKSLYGGGGGGKGGGRGGGKSRK